MKKFLLTLVLFASCQLRLAAELTRFEIKQRVDVGSSGYEKIIGTAHFALDPLNVHNRVIADIDRAPTTAQGRVEFSADLHLLRPKESAKSNGVALIEVANRGRKGTLSLYSRSAGRELDPATDADLGDGFLTGQGYTLVWVGWQFDAPHGGGYVSLKPPVAKGISARVTMLYTPAERGTETDLTDLADYTLDPADPDAALTVRDGLYGKAESIVRANWSVADGKLTLKTGFEPGRTYEIAMRAIDVPVAGTGLAAFRDTATWLKHQIDAAAPVRYVYAYGGSQSGRFLRTFLYYGFNSDEHGQQVYDGILAHIAGSARLSINERGGRPNASQAPSPRFPYSDVALKDPISGKTEGLLDNERARANQPKIFYTNTPVEYWGADRTAALVHTSPDGKTDLKLQDNVRVYFLTGTQHGPAAFPAQVTTGQQPVNPLEYAWTMRALLTAMDNWMRKGTPPPASNYPRLADGTLVAASKIDFPAIPGVSSPRRIPGGRVGAVALPQLVPAVDADGNERSGIRTAEQAVPVATYTGWNFRSAKVGGTAYLFPLLGSRIPFARTLAERQATHDPRLSLVERYPSKERYLALAQAHCEKLIAGGYLLAGDVPRVMKRIEDQWPSASLTSAVSER